MLQAPLHLLMVTALLLLILQPAIADVQLAPPILGAKVTAKQVIDRYGKDDYLRGKTAVVTGGNSGIGLETCKALASAGAHVILCSRSVKSAERAQGHPHYPLISSNVTKRPQSCSSNVAEAANDLMQRCGLLPFTQFATRWAIADKNKKGFIRKPQRVSA